jgi:hypothetical protein
MRKVAQKVPGIVSSRSWQLVREASKVPRTRRPPDEGTDTFVLGCLPNAHTHRAARRQQQEPGNSSAIRRHKSGRTENPPDPPGNGSTRLTKTSTKRPPTARPQSKDKSKQLGQPIPTHKHLPPMQQDTSPHGHIYTCTTCGIITQAHSQPMHTTNQPKRATGPPSRSQREEQFIL